MAIQPVVKDTGKGTAKVKDNDTDNANRYMTRQFITRRYQNERRRKTTIKTETKTGKSEEKDTNHKPITRQDKDKTKTRQRQGKDQTKTKTKT